MANDRQVQDLGDKSQVFRLGSGIIIGDVWIYQDDDGNIVVENPKGTKVQSFDGAVARNAANVNAVGAIPILHRTTIPSGANGDVDITVTYKFRVVDAWFVLKGAGTGGSTVTLKNGTNAISDAVDVSSGGDKDRFGVGEIDDAQHEVAAGGTLRWSKASSGADFPGAEAYALGVRIA